VIDTRQYDLFELAGGKVVRAVLGCGTKEDALEAARRSEYRFGRKQRSGLAVGLNHVVGAELK
jgi:hypothetical protein